VAAAAHVINRKHNDDVRNMRVRKHVRTRHRVVLPHQNDRDSNGMA